MIDRRRLAKLKMVEHWKEAKRLMGKRRAEGDRENIILNAAAMHAFQAINYALDLMEEIIKEKQWGLPFSYTQYPLLLMEKDLLSEKEAWHLVRLIRLRNRIAHEYHTFSEKDMKDLIEGLDALEALQPL